VLEMVPIVQRDAFAFVAKHHRHHRPPRGSLFQVAVGYEEHIVGVAIVGRPVARKLQDGRTAEVTRLCTDGARNAASKLLAACWRIARDMGYWRMVTYTLPWEGGASLRAAGWELVGPSGGGSWSRPSRPRRDRHPTQVKQRWEVRAPGR
jgi:hypothetical protein